MLYFYLESSFSFSACIIDGRGGALKEGGGKIPEVDCLGGGRAGSVGNLAVAVGLARGGGEENGSIDGFRNGIAGTDPCPLNEGKVRPGPSGDSGEAPTLMLRGRGRGRGLNGPVICLRKGFLPPSDVLAPSVSLSLVLVMFSSEDVIGVTLLAKSGPAVTGIVGRGGG